MTVNKLHRIEAAGVNHNTSAYMELMLRSLFAKHSADLPLSVTVYDNASTDDMTGLTTFAANRSIPIVQSGFSTESKNNSHGEVLRRFVLEHPDCSHYLFLDADVCFIHQNTIASMLETLEACDDAFGIVPRMLWWDRKTEFVVETEANPDIYQARLHPCCALIKNTDLFRLVVEEIGLSCANYLWAAGDEYLDTFKLMTKVMKTHGFRHLIAAQQIIHFFCVAYDWEPTQHLAGMKAAARDALLAEYRH